MVIVFRLLGVAKSANRFNHIILWIGLARVNHVVNRVHPAKVRMLRLSCLRRYPHLPAIGITIETLITKIAPEQTKLPKMVGNVFADVSHSSVGAHNHLGIFIGTIFTLITFGFSSIIAFGCGLPFSRRRRSPLHHPAALVLAFGLKVE